MKYISKELAAKLLSALEETKAALKQEAKDGKHKNGAMFVWADVNAFQLTLKRHGISEAELKDPVPVEKEQPKAEAIETQPEADPVPVEKEQAEEQPNGGYIAQQVVVGDVEPHKERGVPTEPKTRKNAPKPPQTDK